MPSVHDAILIACEEAATLAAAGGPAALLATHSLQGNIFTPQNDGHYMIGSAGVTAGDEFTLGIRVHWHDTSVTQSGQIMGVSEDDGTDTNYENGVILRFNGADDLQVRSYDDDSSFAGLGFWDGLSAYNNIGSTNFPDSAWTTLFLVYDGSADVADVYSNGVLATRTNTVAHVTLSSASKKIWFFDPTGSTIAPFGYVSHFGFWNRELTSDEIAALDAADNHDWQIASGNYGASAVSALQHFYIATDGTIATFQTDRVGSYTLDQASDLPVDGQFTALGSEEADATP